ncbi:MAG: hypothetical protein UX06_C0032G0030 [Candidatus Giovannonibacteria bacterium GW2011_GWA2_45_21]|uniref:Ribbon-helix-helix protein CopG domain-containing protein n=1 Tax=Candidatus Giovannonibacteria bacterium GW2011_GWA2_45_21 TaxID=1618649 RepID=A0A0G1Q5H7_9BACT|nr:MAG: hypothetical protein UX06_C0032G0030 [Candidatus Giovannonibacteria bacterium GW2011_GWA2_45_21]
MPTLKTRINISVSDDLADALARIAKRDRMPKATKAALLLASALEIEEDSIWNTIAEKRERKDARFVSHKKAWA